MRTIPEIELLIIQHATKRDEAFKSGKQAQAQLDEIRRRIDPKIRELEERGDKLAAEMRKCMANACEAWDGGDRAAAKVWAVEGHQYKDRCKLVNEEVGKLRKESQQALDQVRVSQQETRQNKEAVLQLRKELEAARRKLRIDYRSIDFIRGDADSWEPLINAWAESYSACAGAAGLNTISLDNGFSYLVDDSTSSKEAHMDSFFRVVAAWGESVKNREERDKSRMSGYPRPERKEDHRGHLIAHASGGGYDLNLVAMDQGVNLGKPLREMEKYCAANPGTPYFIRMFYDGNSERPSKFEVGVYKSKSFWIRQFKNG